MVAIHSKESLRRRRRAKFHTQKKVHASQVEAGPFVLLFLVWVIRRVPANESPLAEAVVRRCHVHEPQSLTEDVGKNGWCTEMRKTTPQKPSAHAQRPPKALS